jgi:polyhydroxybutyrate depolymerase
MLVAALALVGCSSEAKQSAPPTSTSTPATCGTAGTATGRTTMSFLGVERTYQLSLPKSYDRRTRHPVILNLHGLTSNIDEQDIVSNFPKLGGARGYVIVTPQGLDKPLGGPGTPLAAQWNLSPDATGSASDVNFLLALLDRVQQDVCVDPHREYVAGVSDGAAMTMSLRCKAGDRFAAVAAVAGVTLDHCNAKVATPLIAFHGDADPLVSYQGTGVEAAMARLAAAGGCGTTPKVSAPYPDARHLVWPCTGAMGLELWRIIGGGHTWPGVTTYVDPNTARKNPDGTAAGSPYGTASLVKHQTTDVVATKLILDFFDHHPGH